MYEKSAPGADMYVVYAPESAAISGCYTHDFYPGWTVVNPTTATNLGTLSPFGVGFDWPYMEP